MGVGESVTIIVHGTFADDEVWWKPGRDLPPTAADDLEKALRGHGMTGSVWRGLRDDPPARIDVDDPEAVVTAIDDAFGWSGKNRHRDRVEAADHMRGSLEKLSDRFHGSNAGGPREPLHVHLVAHSHGGNIVLEMMKKPPRDVDLRSITMLGTPLIWTFPAFRLFRIAFALLFAAVLTLLMVPSPDESIGESIVFAGFVMLAYPWLFFWVNRLIVMAMRTLDGVWRHVARGGRPPGGPAYGPLPAVAIGRASCRERG